MPLTRGKYPTTNPGQALFGNLTNSADPSTPAFTNNSWPGQGALTNSAIATTGVGHFVAVPVDVGSVLTKMSFVIGATAASTPTHQFGMIYSGIATPALIVQSADTTTAVAAADTLITYTFTAPTLITPALAPNGFIFAGFTFVASTQPTVVSLVTTSTGVWAAAGSNPFGANAPAFMAATAGSSLTTTAAATIASPTASAIAPLIILQ